MFPIKQKHGEMVCTQSETISKDVKSTPFGDVITETIKVEFPKERFRFDKFPLEMQIKQGVKITQVETKVLDSNFDSLDESETNVPRETTETTETTEDSPF